MVILALETPVLGRRKEAAAESLGLFLLALLALQLQGVALPSALGRGAPIRMAPSI